MVDDPCQVTEEQMERWVQEFDSWDLCDGCCGDLFERTRFAYGKAAEWSGRQEEFVKRAGFALMARLAISDKRAPDAAFAAFLPLIVAGAADERNFVRKAVSWALRQIGKRSVGLNAQAQETAHRIRDLGARSARWVAADALRELTRAAVQERLRQRG
jgi:3-methyladenine DNA glycosylase AlkD